MSNDNGGPAFPLPRDTALLANLNPSNGALGMTLRDYFAAKALEGFLANKSRPTVFDPKDDAAYCYVIADAMLAERTK